MPSKPVARRALLGGSLCLLAAPAIVRAESQNNGVALVIGNSKYKWEASLPNVKRDAPDIAKRFQTMGLKTELVQDVGRDGLRSAVDKFGTAARGANLAAFYFAGHGASWDKDTYLVPEDTDLANASTVQSLLPVTAVRDAMKEARHRLLAFDNCRNNPADGWRQREAVISSSMASSELAAASLTSPNTLVLFSTAPGRVAVDGPAGDNSPFAAAFLRQLAAPSVDLQALPAKLRRDLLIATEGRQLLWDQNTYDQPFTIANAAGRPAPPPQGTASRIVELDKTYAFAREKGLLLPSGLIALRSPNGSPHDIKTGSYQTLFRIYIGAGNSNQGQFLESFILIVISVAEGNTAEIIVATKNWTDLGGLARGSVWRYSTAELSGSSLRFNYGRLAKFEAPVEFKWSDANSGRQSSPTNAGWYNATFTRLDG